MFSQDQVSLISGYGLVCHRAIKIIAELAGIEDMYCKTEGRTKNYLSLTKAFFHGLESQVDRN